MPPVVSHCAGFVFFAGCKTCKRQTDNPDARATMQGMLIDGRCPYRLLGTVEIAKIKEQQNARYA